MVDHDSSFPLTRMIFPCFTCDKGPGQDELEIGDFKIKNRENESLAVAGVEKESECISTRTLAWGRGI